VHGRNETKPLGHTAESKTPGVSEDFFGRNFLNVQICEEMKRFSNTLRASPKFYGSDCASIKNVAVGQYL